MKAESISKTRIFEELPIPKAISTLAVPTIISQLINLIYNMVDTLFIGRTGNPYMVAALTVSFTIFMLDISFSNLCGIGGGSLMARLAGKKEDGRAKSVAAFSLYFSVFVSLVYSLLIFLFLEPLLYKLGASDNTIGFAKQYIWTVVIIGNLPTIVSLTVAHLLRNQGYSKQASIGLSGGGILNIVLDPLFMFVIMEPGQEVLGAGIATLLSNVISCLYLLFVFFSLSSKSNLSGKIKDLKAIEKRDIRDFFAVGVPTSLLTALFDLANICLNSLISVYGDIELASLGIVMKIERLPNAINLGMCQGMLPLVAYNYASGNRDRMNSAISYVRRTGLLISACTIVFFELCARPAVMLFMNTGGDNAEAALKALEFATVFLKIRCLVAPFQFLNYHTSNCLQAIGDGAGTLLHTFFREVVFYIPLMYLFNYVFGKMGLVSAIIAGEGLGAVAALVILNISIKKRKNVNE